MSSVPQGVPTPILKSPVTRLSRRHRSRPPSRASRVAFGGPHPLPLLLVATNFPILLAPTDFFVDCFPAPISPRHACLAPAPLVPRRSARRASRLASLAPLVPRAPRRSSISS